MRSILAIDLAAAGHGLLSNDPDPDGVFRRLRLVSTVRGAVAPDLSLEVYRLAEGERSFTLYPVPSGRGLNRIAVGPPDFSTKPDPSRSTFPTEPDGSLWIDYARDPPPSFSAKDVLSGRTLPQNFDGRLVLIGLTGVGLVDQARKTPAGLMPGIEINAQGLENLIAHQLVHRQLAHRPGGARVAEATLSFVAGLFLIVALPAARGPRRVMAALAPLLALGVLGGVLWSQDRVLADVATPALGCGVVLLSLLGGGLAQLRRELELQRLAAARLEGELQAGGKIQRSLLRTRWEFDARVDLHADMVPALHTGGDFYDFVPLGSDHLFIAVGDVSGKGLHAAIFSVIGQVLGESCALRGETDIGAIVRSANAEISRNNREALFITLFAGILDLKSGELSFSNAGHDTPFLLRPGQPPAAVTGVGGPPLCVLDDFPYDTETLRLQPGDIICVTTDGVTEAMTKAGDLLGRGAVEQVLAATPPNASARDVTMALKRAVSEFVAGAEPSDDLTILTVRWRGPHPT